MSNTKNSEASPRPKKVKRPKGPIRWGGLLPLGILTAGIIVYFVFFFDLHLKWLIEWSGAKVNGARVDVGYLKTSFIHCDFEVRKIEVASPKEAMKNRFEIGRIHFNFLFVPLLSKKVVIDEMTVEDILYGTDRRYSGLIPQDPNQKSRSFEELLEEYMPGVYSDLKARYSENPLNKVGKLFSSFDIQGELKKVQGDLKSLNRAKEIEAAVKKAETELPTKVKSLPDASYADAKKKEIEAITKRPFKNPNDVKAAVDEIGKIKNDVDSKIKQVDQTFTEVKTQTDQLVQGAAQIDNLINEDIRDLKSKLKLPQIDFKDLSEQIFGPHLIQHVEKLSYWIAYARKKMPKGKKEGEITVTEEKRASGTDVRFGYTKTYPGFLVRRAMISSAVSEDREQGSVKGELTGLTSDPAVYGKPTQLSLTGDFPRRRLMGAKLQATIDHTTQEASETIVASVQSFPVEDWSLSQSDDMKLAIQKSVSSAQFKAKFTDARIDTQLRSRLTQVQYLAESRHALLQKTLQTVVEGLDTFGVDAQIGGPWDKVGVQIHSDLGEKLATGFKREFQTQIDALNQEIRKKVNDQVESKKKELNSRIESLKQQVLKPVEEKKQKIAALKQEADNAVNKVKDQAKKEAESKVKSQIQQQIQQKAPEPVKNLKKKFGF